MLFKRLLSSVLMLLACQGCGLLGTKSPLGGSSGVGSTGCLNNSPDLVNRFLKGDMTEPEWKTSFDCINQSLDFFTEYVRGSAKNAYTQSDMYTLISKFLITNAQVRPDLMKGAFALKSALFGGDDSEFTNEQVTLLKTSLTRLSNITGALIPVLSIRKKANPTEQDLNDLMSAFQNAGDQLADFINTLPVGMLSENAVDTLIQELTVSLNLPAFDHLADTVFLAKWMLFNTRRDAIENQDWAKVFRTAMGLGGVILAAKIAVGDSGVNSDSFMTRLLNDYNFREMVWRLALQLKPYLQDALALHDGSIPLPLLDHIFDELSDDFLNRTPKDVLKKTLRPVLRKMLRSTSQTGFDQGNIDTIYGLLQDIVTDLGMVDRMYSATGVDWEHAAPDQMSRAIADYRNSLSDPKVIARWDANSQILKTYRPLFHKKTTASGTAYTIRYGKDTGYTHFQNAVEIMLDHVGKLLMKGYASGQTYLIDNDLISFFKEYIDILFAMRIVDPTVPNYALNRLRDMDLFTPSSNGDGRITIDEIVNYGMLIISASELGARMKNEITPVCDTGLGTDLMGWTLIPADCFRKQFEDRLPYWIEEEFPRLNAYWKTLTPDQQVKAMMWLEHGSRRDGYSKEDMGSFDIGAMASIIYYTESLFTRYDADGSEDLSKSEINTAYPSFKELIKKKVAEKGIDTDSGFLLKGVFTYIVKYREIPLTDINFGSIVKLAWWLIKYDLPTTNYSSDRLGVFNIVCQLAIPENPNLATPNKIVCAP